MWIEPTLHMKYSNNHLRGKFAKSLHIASQMHDRAIVVPLRQMWSDNSPNMIDSVRNRLTFSGLSTFWRGVDQAVRFADTKMLRNFGINLKQVFQKPKLQKESEEAFDHFEKRLAARRDLTRQLQMNQVVRFFNNQVQRMEARQPAGPRNTNNQRPDQGTNNRRRHHHKTSCRQTTFHKEIKTFTHKAFFSAGRFQRLYHKQS